MTTIDTRPGAASGAAGDAPADREALVGVSAFFSGAAAWITSTDHKRIGRLYAGFGLVVLLATAIVGAVLGIERADAGSDVLDGGSLLQVFQAYRVGLVFGGIVPLALGLGIAVTPLQLGARSIAFPRVALTGFYAWLGGMALVFAALGRNGGIGGGDPQAVDLFLAGHGLAVLGLTASAGCLVTSVLTARAPGMTMRRVPLFAWSTLVGGLALLLVMPVAFGTVIYLFIDHRIGIQANFGGAEGIGTWMGFVYTVPAVIAFALPAVGVAAELIPVTFRARQQLRGVKFAGIALIGVTAFAAVTRQLVNPLTLDADQEFRAFVEDFLPFLLLAGLPLLGLLVAMALAALTARSGISGGRPTIIGAFVFGFLGLSLLGLAIVANVVQSITDLELAGTAFEEGATLLAVYGGALALMGGLVFWAPKLWGSVVPTGASIPLALLGALSTALAAGPLLVAGFLDAPGGVPTNDGAVDALLDPSWSGSAELLAVLSVAGHALMALTMLGLVGLLLKAATGPAADANPYGAHTIEWSAASPAPAHNYDHVPTVASAEPQFDLTAEGSRP